MNRHLRLILLMASIVSMVSALPCQAAAVSGHVVTPGAGDTLTAGSFHTIQMRNEMGYIFGLWLMQGGTVVRQIAPPPTNAQEIVWQVPYELVPGVYELQLFNGAFYTTTGPLYVAGPPICPNGFHLATLSTPVSACGATLEDARQNAREAVYQALQEACDQQEIALAADARVDLTQLRLDRLPCNYPFQVEGTAVFCCGSAATKVEATSWGRLKAFYR